MKKRVHIYYSGMVQGVGFRYTAERYAVSLGVGGWAKNLPNGQVELMAEGEEADLILLLQKIKDGPLKPYIRNADIHWSPHTGEFRDFAVKF